jgi:putative Mn2+ efflux pump MntP
MKALFTALAVGVVAFALTACNGTAPTVPQLTPAQFVAAVCPSVKQALAVAPTLTALIPAAAQSKVADATPIVTAACAQGATVSTATVTQFVQTVFPAVSAIVGAAPTNVLSSDVQAQIQGAILLAELGVGAVTAVQTAAAAQAASAPASAPVAASAPASK